jgi:mitochondrial fission protein ELM1
LQPGKPTLQQTNLSEISPQAPPRIWLLMGHRAGDNSQVHALGEALGWPFEIKRFVYRRTELLTNLLLGPTLAGVVKDRSSTLEPPWPDLILTAGRRNEPICLWIQKQARGQKVRLVHVGRTWAKIERFDLIVTTPQYRLPERPNVLHNTTPLHRITAARLAAEAAAWRPRFDHLPGPHVAVVIGGNSGPFTFDAAAGARLAHQASDLAESLGGSLLVTTSARSPAASVAAFERELRVPAHIYRWSRDAAENPYFALLGLAHSIVVTGDSMSMLTEACATAKPVYIFDLGVGEQAMRIRPRGQTASPSGPRRKGWERSHAKAFVYRQTMRFGPQRLTRDIRIIHGKLVDKGHAAWLGDPFPEQAPPPVESVERAVARVRALFQPQAAPVAD